MMTVVRYHNEVLVRGGKEWLGLALALALACIFWGAGNKGRERGLSCISLGIREI